jgi:tRNA-splicing ligase RtcB (3'-phosphate/5'-hydroxy nucleic acid ligase)
MRLEAKNPYQFEIPAVPPMRVGGVVYATSELLPERTQNQALEQVANVATLPGIVEASYAMPDIHWGYGFPIGGVAATDVGGEGVISPGGVGFDISCGVRLLAAQLDAGELAPRLGRVMDALSAAVPRGAGRGAVWQLASHAELTKVLSGGARYAVSQGHGNERDLVRCEDAGAVGGAEPGQVSERALDRGAGQVGSLGSGNHFLEVQVVRQVYDPEAAAAFGLADGQVCVMIHCGSRGLGHQICGDHVRLMDSAMERYRIRVPDRQLACAPASSAEGRAYIGAMAAAANYARANRQLLAEAARRAFAAEAGSALDLVYDVSHNLAKIETHEVGGRKVKLCVHRKGATLALPPGHPDLIRELRHSGQPVLVPGSMGTASWVLAGVAGGGAFGSACHGAGRQLSRHQAARAVKGAALRRRLEAEGVAVRGTSARGLAEEAPEAYKDVDQVVDAATAAGLCRKVARLVPVGVVKG